MCVQKKEKKCNKRDKIINYSDFSDYGRENGVKNTKELDNTNKWKSSMNSYFSLFNKKDQENNNNNNHNNNNHNNKKRTRKTPSDASTNKKVKFENKSNKNEFKNSSKSGSNKNRSKKEKTNIQVQIKLDVGTIERIKQVEDKKFDFSLISHDILFANILTVTGFLIDQTIPEEDKSALKKLAKVSKKLANQFNKRVQNLKANFPFTVIFFSK